MEISRHAQTRRETAQAVHDHIGQDMTVLAFGLSALNHADVDVKDLVAATRRVGTAVTQIMADLDAPPRTVGEMLADIPRRLLIDDRMPTVDVRADPGMLRHRATQNIEQAIEQCYCVVASCGPLHTVKLEIGGGSSMRLVVVGERQVPLDEPEDVLARLLELVPESTGHLKIQGTSVEVECMMSAWV